jgi:hypothetical protein
LLMPVDMREWLPEDDLVFVVLDAVAVLSLSQSAGRRGSAGWHRPGRNRARLGSERPRRSTHLPV